MANQEKTLLGTGNSKHIGLEIGALTNFKNQQESQCGMERMRETVVED